MGMLRVRGRGQVMNKEIRKLSNDIKRDAIAQRRLFVEVMGELTSASAQRNRYLTALESIEACDTIHEARMVASAAIEGEE